MTDPSFSTDLSHLRASGADIAAISQVVLYERQARDSGWWAQMGATYWPEAIVNLAWHQGTAADFVARSKEMFDRGVRPLHHMYTPVVHINGSKAHVEAPAVTWSRWSIDGTECNLHSHMRLHYRLEERAGQWGIVRFDCVYVYSEVSPVVPGEKIVIPSVELASHRASYALLAWHQTRRGMSVDDDQLGVDRPEQLEEFLARTREWLRGDAEKDRAGTRPVNGETGEAR